MSNLFTNTGDPDQMLHSVTSDLSLHSLQITLLEVSRLQWVKDNVSLGLEVFPFLLRSQNPKQGSCLTLNRELVKEKYLIAILG